MESNHKAVLEKYSEYPNFVLKKILEQYKAMCEEISADDFKELEDAIPKKSTVQINFIESKFLEKFKSGLYETIESKLNVGWENNGISDKLKLLEHFKDTQKRDGKAWRPTGKPAEEQVKHLEIKSLLRRKQCYEKHLNFQNQQLQDIISKCVEARDYLNNLCKERQEMSKKIDADLEVISEKEKKITESSLKLL